MCQPGLTLRWAVMQRLGVYLHRPLILCNIVHVFASTLLQSLHTGDLGVYIAVSDVICLQDSKGSISGA